MATIWWYDKKKNPGGSMGFPGVPLGNISEEMWNSYPKWLQKSIEASPMYLKTNPDPEPREAEAEAESAPAEKPKPTDKEK